MVAHPQRVAARIDRSMCSRTERGCDRRRHIVQGPDTGDHVAIAPGTCTLASGMSVSNRASMPDVPCVDLAVVPGSHHPLMMDRRNSEHAWEVRSLDRP